MKKYRSTLYVLLLFIFATCHSDKQNEAHEKKDDVSIYEHNNEIKKKEEKIDVLDFKVDTIIEQVNFATAGFDNKKYYELLIETHLCNPEYNAATNDGSTPCSSRLFNFFPYNHNKKIEDAFLLQVKAGVNNYPYRRLLIFVREDGKLILMNGVVGYIVKRITQPNKIDDLVVAVIDDLGNNSFDRYDVLIRYKNGKYHFEEAIGDLQGTFDTPELKKRATEAISQRIKEKELIF